MDKPEKKNNLTIFIEEFSAESPIKLHLSEIGTTLGDYCKAYVLMKKEGDSLGATSLYYKTYSNCLFTTLVQKYQECLATLN